MVEIFRAGENEVYRIEGPAGELLIPALRDVVRSIDLAVGGGWSSATRPRRSERWQANGPARSSEIDVVTLFPELFDAPLRTSVIGRAVERGILVGGAP